MKIGPSAALLLRTASDALLHYRVQGFVDGVKCGFDVNIHVKHLRRAFLALFGSQQCRLVLASQVALTSPCHRLDDTTPLTPRRDHYGGGGGG
ncbi:hypothetical protein E2C01_012878 [Portunus trituberculatus]|uniref:Uncharacterized protein n=1 Tax=Portunus trituberculatus TaxID=210409 RepID=A0A5B7DFL9_PORTR|nr:hypothetical protein [Portunus trituberculatus]